MQGEAGGFEFIITDKGKLKTKSGGTINDRNQVVDLINEFMLGDNSGFTSNQ